MPTRAQGQLQLSPALTKTSHTDFVLDDIKTGTLISLRQLCDDDLKKDEVIITGKRDDNGLWSIPLKSTSPPLQANAILRLDGTKQSLAAHHHASLSSPSTSTLLRAIRLGHLLTFPGLTTNLVSNHLPKSLATTLVHQDQEAKNLRSKQQVPILSLIIDIDISPNIKLRTHNICKMLVSTAHILKSYSDQTRKFPTISSRGNHYIFVFNNYDTNSIHATSIPNRQAASICTAWENNYKSLIQHGHPTDIHILDNKCSQDLKNAFTKYHVPFQRVPPKEHRVNSAKRAIRTFKNHIFAILASVDTNYPLSEWDRLLPQDVLTLNLL